MTGRGCEIGALTCLSYHLHDTESSLLLRKRVISCALCTMGMGGGEGDLGSLRHNELQRGENQTNVPLVSKNQY